MKSHSVNLLSQLALLYFTVAIIRLVGPGCSCIEKERHAILTFKEGVRDYGNLVSWTDKDEDCCRWRGVGCQNQTGHITLLDLRPTISYSHYGTSYSWNPMKGEISSSLLELRYLSHLDLSLNSFTKIPEFIGSLNELTYLNLSWNNFSGNIPYQFGSLSKLLSLDLSHNHGNMTTKNLEWLSGLHSLRILKLSRTNLIGAVSWLRTIKSHPSLSSLYLDHCQLPEIDPSSLSNICSSNSLSILHMSSGPIQPSLLPWLLNMSTTLVEVKLFNNQLKGPIPDSFHNSGSLEYLDFSENLLEGGIPRSLGNLCKLKTLLLTMNNLYGPFSGMLWNLSWCTANSLQILGLSGNQLNGSFPDEEIRRFSSLRELYLVNNQLEGQMPDTLADLWSLTVLDLAANKLTGPLPQRIGEMSSLKVLDISVNSFNCVISEIHLLKLSNLKVLALSLNSISLNFNSSWLPPFQLDTIEMRSCKLGPLFPRWLQNQGNLSHLDIANSGISDDIPNWFWSLSSNLIYLNLSLNNIRGQVPDLPLKFTAPPLFDLSSNLFYGPIVGFLFNSMALDLSQNMFSGSLSSLCTVTNSNLSFLDLSDNNLSGSLPNCWMNFRSLTALILEKNNFSDAIPTSMGSLNSLQTLRLGKNNLSGELPPTMKACTLLKLLDLGENNFSGSIPSWIGESMPNLIVLRLRSNNFLGEIPQTLCRLVLLQILDLSFNHISGTLPPCINNFTAMAQKGTSDAAILYYLFFEKNADTAWVYDDIFIDRTDVVWKGVEQEYGNTLGLLKVIDLSSNYLAGEIPREATSLLDLITLNLSRNTLSGHIPDDIGQLKGLESLDLFMNQLSGEIPVSLANLFFLSYLNLSNNNLSGKIPSSTQLQSFHADSYMGNIGLCGPPLYTKCLGEKKRQQNVTQNSNQDGEQWYQTSGFYISIALGFAVGFWTVCGTLWSSTNYSFFECPGGLALFEDSFAGGQSAA